MKSLFFRIFLTLLLTIACISAGAIYLTRVYYDGYKIEKIPDSLMEQLASSATHTLQQRGKRHLRLWLRGLREEKEIVAFLLTDRLKPIGVKRIPRFLRREFGAFKHEWSQEHHSEFDEDNDAHHEHERHWGDDGYDRPRFQWLRTERNGNEYIFVAANVPKPWKGSSMFTKSVVFFLVFTIVSSFVIAWVVAAPLRRLQKTTRDFAAGQWETRTSQALKKRKDVIGDLGREFNHMADAISNLITSQQRLLRDISHELRTPLARMRVAVELIPPSQGSGDAAVQRLRTEVGRLDSLIGEVLSLTRLKGGFESFNERVFDLMQSLANIVDDAEYEFGEQPKSIKLVGPEHFWVRLDEEKISSAVENLVRNAMRYTQAETCVQVSLNVGSDAYRICVEDHGPGVPEADLPKLFDAFFRVQEARDRESGGHGVGLAIAKGIAEHYRGTLSAHNRAEGGLCVELYLPKSTMEKEPPQPDSD